MPGPWGEAVRMQLASKGWTQTTLRKQAHISKNTITRVVHGQHVETRVLQKIADALGVQTFIAAEAWGTFNARSFSKTLRRHGWPAGVRPYALRSTFAIDLLLKGASLGDVQGLLGHRQIETTRTHYTLGDLRRRPRRGSGCGWHTDLSQ